MTAAKKHYHLFWFSIAIALGIFTGYLNNPYSITVATSISKVFILLLQWLSIPIIFLSIISSVAGLQNKNEFLSLGKHVAKYTLLTTIIAATVALIFFIILDPVNTASLQPVINNAIEKKEFSNVFGIILMTTVFATIALSFFIITRPPLKRQILNMLFLFLYTKLMRIVTLALYFMPVAIWAFVTLFVIEINELKLQSLSIYFTSIVLSNLAQALIILPLLLIWKKIPIISTFRAMLPALTIGFWARSSNVALPVTIECATEEANISPKIAKFSLPLCTTINMNACAAFILTTVLYVAMSNGVTFSPAEFVMWIFIATIAAIGNAGVPMGCYALSGILLGYLDVPLHLLGLILPFYAVVDMFETAVNIWSDACITASIDKDLAIN